MRYNSIHCLFVDRGTPRFCTKKQEKLQTAHIPLMLESYSINIEYINPLALHYFMACLYFNIFVLISKWFENK